MKAIKTVLIAFIGLSLFTGCSGDDEFYNAKYLSIPNLIEIEHQENFGVGDVLWVNTNFSRFLDEPNQTTPLDIYQTTGGASFSFVYGLEKKTGEDTWTQISLEGSMVEDQGNLISDYFAIAESIYNPATETYDFRAGIPLAETGEYRLIFGFSEVSRLELTSNNPTDAATYLNIQTTTNNLTNGYYNFNVN